MVRGVRLRGRADCTLSGGDWIARPLRGRDGRARPRRAMRSWPEMATRMDMPLLIAGLPAGDRWKSRLGPGCHDQSRADRFPWA